jgi:hypothetical protein
MAFGKISDALMRGAIRPTDISNPARRPDRRAECRIWIWLSLVLGPHRSLQMGWAGPAADARSVSPELPRSYGT